MTVTLICELRGKEVSFERIDETSKYSTNLVLDTATYKAQVHIESANRVDTPKKSDHPSDDASVWRALGLLPPNERTNWNWLEKVTFKGAPFRLAESEATQAWSCVAFLSHGSFLFKIKSKNEKERILTLTISQVAGLRHIHVRSFVLKLDEDLVLDQKLLEVL